MPPNPFRLPLGLAALLLVWSLAARADVAAAPQTIAVRGGTIRDLEIRLAPDPVRSGPVGVRLVPEKRWGSDLSVRGDDHQLSSAPPGSAWEWIIPSEEASRGLRLQVAARTCSANARYPATLEVWAGGPTVQRLASVPLVFSVERSGLGCAGIRTGALGGTGLVLLLLLYLWGMWAHSRFIKHEDLVRQIRPIRKLDGHEWELDRDRQSKMKEGVRTGLTAVPRLLAWMKANPFLVGLPGRRYDETVEILLSRGSRGVQVSPSAPADKDPEPGKLYASASRGGPVFFGRSKPRHLDGQEWEEICGFVLHSNFTKTIFSLPPVFEEDREGEPRFGWEIRPGLRRSAQP